MNIDFDKEDLSGRIGLYTDNRIRMGAMRTISPNFSIGIDLLSVKHQTYVKFITRFKNFKGLYINQSQDQLPSVPISACLSLVYPHNLVFDSSIWSNRQYPNLRFATRVTADIKNKEYTVSAGSISTFEACKYIPYPAMVALMLSSRGTIFAMVGAKIDSNLKIGVGFQASKSYSRFGLFIDI